MEPKKLNDDEIEQLLTGLEHEWHLAPNDELRRVYLFKDFGLAMKFVNKVAEAAEAENHHPDIVINYTKVTLTLATHSVGGLTEKDFSLARQIDARTQTH